MNIFIGSLPFSLKETELRSYFEKYGEVTSVKIITDKYSGKSKGFGFIEMPDEDSAKEAIEELNDSEISGRKVVVNKAEEKKEGDRRSNFRGGGGNRPHGGGGGGYQRGGGGGYGRRNDDD
jgi:RNA recognition motif-containing protein